MYRSAILRLALVFGNLIAIPVIAQTANTDRVADTYAASTVPTAPLTVSISGLRNEKGQVLIYLWNAPEGFPTKDKGYKSVAIGTNKAINGSLTTTFDVPPGIYAVSMLHDENKNGKMDTNFLGIPREGYGVSNNVVNRFQAPSFEQAKLEVPASGQNISILVRY